MKIFDLEKIQKKSNPQDLYDLTQETFEYKRDIQYLTYKIQRGEEMRIDLVCQSIYGNIDNIDIILNVNNISNPLNIKEGSVIIYPNSSDISNLRPEIKDNSEVVKSLANSNKSTRIDRGRQAYIESNYSLPPTVLQSSIEQVKISQNSINLGNDLFNK